LPFVPDGKGEKDTGSRNSSLILLWVKRTAVRVSLYELMRVMGRVMKRIVAVMLQGVAPLRRPASIGGSWRMRFLCITPNHGTGNTALSQPGRQSGRAKPRERRRFSIIGRCTFSPPISDSQFFLFFHRKSFLNSGVKITLHQKNTFRSSLKREADTTVKFALTRFLGREIPSIWFKIQHEKGKMTGEIFHPI